MIKQQYLNLLLQDWPPTSFFSDVYLGFVAQVLEGHP